MEDLAREEEEIEVAEEFLAETGGGQKKEEGRVDGRSCLHSTLRKHFRGFELWTVIQRSYSSDYFIQSVKGGEGRGANNSVEYLHILAMLAFYSFLKLSSSPILASLGHFDFTIEFTSWTIKCIEVFAQDLILSGSVDCATSKIPAAILEF